MTTKQEYDEAGQAGARREAHKEGSPVTADMVEAACQAVAKFNGSDQYPDGKHKDYWVCRKLIRAAVEAALDAQAGMVMVPVASTSAMDWAGVDAAEREHYIIPSEVAERIWDAMLAAAPAGPVNAQAGGWLPIESAPRDGTWVVGRYADGDYIPPPYAMRFVGGEWVDGGHGVRNPTQWHYVAPMLAAAPPITGVV